MGSFKKAKYNYLEREEAETIALQCITFLAEDDRRINRFIALTGINAEELSQNINQSEVLVAALEYLQKDESLLLMFASNYGVLVENLYAAHAALEKIAVHKMRE